ncbi:MAG: lamin tail domain-containing protein, partial [Deltaproteobacteria bacterium]|nr:lamin tail domain-containing protein [Deltaproteobacteria bacterium]
GSAPPGTRATLYARACLTSDPTCCATSAPAVTDLIETCTTPVAPPPANLIFSEYVPNGDGPCSGPDCEAGEAFEITNLSHCPVDLSGHHFSYCNSGCSTFRWMNFGAADIVPPRGVYVAIRNQAASMCFYPFFGPDDPNLFGLKISGLVMMSSGGGANGWFVNAGGGSSVLRIATGTWVDITGGTTIDIVSPYSAASECSSIGFDAYDACGEVSPLATPTDVLTPNQLGRLWQPCDAVASPVPAGCL